jgi:ATP-dependent RNA circularization protein (DNA/RNA ligase family)
MYAGSRKLWKKQGSSIWRQALQDNPDIELWCENFPGYTLYGEVVPTQKGFDYGVEQGKAKVFFFDILTPDKEWMPYLEARRITESFDLEWVPCLYQGVATEEQIKSFVDGKTLTHGDHIREGIVVRVQPEKIVRGLGRAQVKIVSNEYYEKTKE